jgi:hypothetical protein
MSEQFIKALFTKLKPKDFNHTPFLKSFYSAAVKEKVDLYSKYLEYLSRNKTSDRSHDTYLKNLMDEIHKNILDGQQGEKAFSKMRALDVLSEALEASSVTVDADPYQQNYNLYVEEFDDHTHMTLLKGVADDVQQDQRVIPVSRPDAEFAARSERLKLYSMNRIDLNEMKPLINDDHHNTSNTNITTINITTAGHAQQNATQQTTQQNAVDVHHQAERHAEKKLKFGILSKMYLVNSLEFADMWTKAPKQRLNTIETVTIYTDDQKPKVILPAQKFAADYGPAAKTTFTISSVAALDEAAALVLKKKRVLYICAGSADVCGGSADQGNICQESALYYRTTYPLAIETALYAYPLKAGICAICPNVLIIKDHEYKPNMHAKYQRVAVMMAPAPFRPKTNLPPNDTREMDERLFAADTVYAAGTVHHLSHYIEVALFFGYTNIILDDRGCRDNWLPVRATAAMINETVKRFNNRLETITLCVPDDRIREIMKQTWAA